MIAPARTAAFEILLKVATTDAHSDELLRGRDVDALSAQDRALVTTLALGTLRWRMKLDNRIRALLARPEAKLAPAVETALRLGAFQLLYLDRIPAHAAIGESVELAKQAGETYAAGMVNAVLRKLARLPRVCEQSGESPEAFAHPRWMVERWAHFYGREAARAICAYNQQPAPVCLRLAHPDAERTLADEGIEVAPGEFLTAARRVVRGDAVRSEAFRRGWVRIQDEGSQLVAELAGRGASILDTCAAPGGKTAILAERSPEAKITAVDVSRRRLEAMRRNFPDDRIKFVLEDAAEMRVAPEYDLILCDVPCTGTGTIARNPEIRFRVSEAEMARQHERQVKILSRALLGLAPGGRLLYSTCSLEPEENEAVLAECLGRTSGFEAVALDGEIAMLEREGVLHADGARKLRKSALRGRFLRTLPGVHPCDGFFAALLTARL
ncbi:MAG TPA: transcription antitermination factor NusB [Acidobacteriaceae bacterium]|nr:transcription antitermination factor NusB [Acidobacteriaceae bacterium]